MPRNPGHPTIQKIRSSQTHCVNGHELTAANVYIASRKNGLSYRQCKRCRAQRERERRMREKVRALRKVVAALGSVLERR